MKINKDRLWEITKEYFDLLKSGTTSAHLEDISFLLTCVESLQCSLSEREAALFQLTGASSKECTFCKMKDDIAKKQIAKPEFLVR